MILARHPVQVTTVHPGGIKTAIARNAGAAEGLDAEQLAKTFDRIARTSPRRAAEIILDGVSKNRARVLVGTDAKVLDLLLRLTGSGAYQQLFLTVQRRLMPAKD
jgi:short-subunit dehydrogenase